MYISYVKAHLFGAVSQLSIFTADCLRHPIQMAGIETIQELHTLTVINSWFYQEALPKFLFLSCIDSLLTIRDRHWRKVATMFETAESANSLRFAQNGMSGAYFCMSAYKRDVVVVIKMGDYIHG